GLEGVDRGLVDLEADHLGAVAGEGERGGAAAATEVDHGRVGQRTHRLHPGHDEAERVVVAAEDDIVHSRLVRRVGHEAGVPAGGDCVAEGRVLLGAQRAFEIVSLGVHKRSLPPLLAALATIFSFLAAAASAPAATPGAARTILTTDL